MVLVYLFGCISTNKLEMRQMTETIVKVDSTQLIQLAKSLVIQFESVRRIISADEKRFNGRTSGIVFRKLQKIQSVQPKTL